MPAQRGIELALDPVSRRLRSGGSANLLNLMQTPDPAFAQTFGELSTTNRVRDAGA